jgi:hypothetical protein
MDVGALQQTDFILASDICWRVHLIGKIANLVTTTGTVLWVLGHLLVLAIGLILVALGETIPQAIGASLVATGVAGETLAFYMLRNEQTQVALTNVATFGLIKLFDGRSARIRPEYDSRLRDMKEGLDVLGFGLSAFLQDYRREVAEWKRRARIRILILDPDFPTSRNSYALQRDREENNEDGRIRTDVENLISALGPLTEWTTSGTRCSMSLAMSGLHTCR